MSGSLVHDLEVIAERTGHRIRSRRTRARTARSMCVAMPLLLVFPIGYALFELVRWASGAVAAPLSPWLVLVCTLALPLLWVGGAAVSTFRRAVDRRDSLATVDRVLGLEDRLQSADEFLQSERRSDFSQAAIEDAEAHAERARTAELALSSSRRRPLRRQLLYVFPAAAFCVLALWLGGLEGTSGNLVNPDRPQVAALQPRTTADEPQGRDETPSPSEQRDRKEPPRHAAVSEVAGRSTADATEDVKESRGSTGLGQAAEASSARGSSSSRASPSNQGQSAKVQPRKQAEKPKKEATAPPPPSPEVPKKKSAEESGTTAGRGASKGSNRNPAASEWSSKDHVQTPEDTAVENDEEIEDEEEEQESRGGIQPNLRDRKPPVNRDLRIGFGSRKNPDANGRGGPSEQKKSRGVASLVLGVPIPDRIKGQPNPGRTKITQERIEPKAEDAEPISAETRTPRRAPIGSLTRRQPPQWMRELVKNYFLSLRTPADKP